MSGFPDLLSGRTSKRLAMLEENDNDRGRNRGRNAMYSLSARGNLTPRYLPYDPEWPLTKLEAFEDRQLANILLLSSQS